MRNVYAPSILHTFIDSQKLTRFSLAIQMQPPLLPRPDLNLLGVNYRRIPVLTLGRDIYLDTRLILSKLETHFPYPTAFPSVRTASSPLLTPTPNLTPDQRALSALLSRWTIDSGIFAAASACIPASSPVFKDPKFMKDREGLTGRSWKKEDMERGRAQAVPEILAGFQFLEGLFGDGREWVLGTKDVSIGDIEGK